MSALTLFLVGTVGVAMVRGGYFASFSPPTVRTGNLFTPLRISGFFISQCVWWFAWWLYHTRLLIWDGIKLVAKIRLIAKVRVSRNAKTGAITIATKQAKKQQQPKEQAKSVEKKSFSKEQIVDMLLAQCISVVEDGNKVIATKSDGSVMVVDTNNCSISTKAKQHVVVRRGARVNPAYVPEEPDHIRQSFTN